MSRLTRQLAPKLAGLSDQRKIHRLLSKEIRRVCDRLSSLMALEDLFIEIPIAQGAYTDISSVYVVVFNLLSEDWHRDTFLGHLALFEASFAIHQG